MMIFFGILIRKDNQVTSRYISHKSNIDVGVIPNPALDIFFSLELLLTAPVIARQAITGNIAETIL